MKKKSFSYAKWGYIFSIPFAVAFLAFMLYPIVYTIVIGFTNMKGMIPPPLQLLSDPFENFKIVLADPLFKKSLVNTFVMLVFPITFIVNGTRICCKYARRKQFFYTRHFHPSYIINYSDIGYVV